MLGKRQSCGALTFKLVYIEFAFVIPSPAFEMDTLFTARPHYIFLKILWNWNGFTFLSTFYLLWTKMTWKQMYFNNCVKNGTFTRRWSTNHGGANLSVYKYFAKTCIKMKELGPKRGRTSLVLLACANEFDLFQNKTGKYLDMPWNLYPFRCGHAFSRRRCR